MHLSIGAGGAGGASPLADSAAAGVEVAEAAAAFPLPLFFLSANDFGSTFGCSLTGCGGGVREAASDASVAFS